VKKNLGMAGKKVLKERECLIDSLDRSRSFANMLSDDDKPIVPLDPTLKGTRTIGIVGAWKSFHGAAWARKWIFLFRFIFCGASYFFFLGQYNMTFPSSRLFASFSLV
jgi:hypothetical protein